MVIFDNILVEGFASLIKPTTFKLNQQGLNIIRGKVGSGKTTIPSALAWCLFGQTLKHKSQVETWPEKRGEDYKGTMVQTNFEIEDKKYQVIRCLNYKGKVLKVKGGNNLFITINGELQNIRNKVDKQKLIEKILGYSFDLFKSSVIFGQKMKKIIEESGPQKKKIFEEAFEVAFIEEAKEDTKEELEKLKSANLNIEATIDDIIGKLEDKQEFYEDALITEKNFREEKKERTKEIKKEIKSLKGEKADIEEDSLQVPKTPSNLQTKIDKLEKEKDDANDKNYKRATYQSDLEDILDEIEYIGKNPAKKGKICPTCGGIMNKEALQAYQKKQKKKLKELKKKKQELKDKIKKTPKSDISLISEKLKELRKEKSEIEAKITQAKERKRRLPKIKSKLVELEGKLRKLEKKTLKIRSKGYKKEIDKLEKRVTTAKSDKEALEKEISIKEWLIKDPLSNNGLKAYMFSSMLGEVNQALEEYSRILGFQVEFGIDLTTHRKDFYQAIEYDGVIIPYEDLSGGQKQLVDTSVAFAIHDTISKIRPTNILFLDEPFESLGVDEIEIIEELVENKSKDKALFLITHHESFNPRNTNDILITRNESGHSQIQ